MLAATPTIQSLLTDCDSSLFTDCDYSPSSLLNTTVTQLMRIDPIAGSTIPLLNVVWKGSVRILNAQDAALLARETQDEVLTRFAARFQFCQEEIAKELHSASDALTTPTLLKFFVVLFVTFAKHATALFASSSFYAVWRTTLAIVDEVAADCWRYL